MELLFYLSLGLNLLLLLFICRRSYSKNAALLKEKKQNTVTVKKTSSRIINKELKKLADECEMKLPQEDRGKVKLLINDKNAQLAALQIGNIRISLHREYKNQSLFQPSSFLEALQLANKGYNGTGRYIPVPHEVEFVLYQRNIINIYLEALGLEQISNKSSFWCVNTETGWKTGWKRFNWDVSTAFAKLADKSMVFLPEYGYVPTTEDKTAKLFLLLKGWEYMFVEV